MPGAASSTRAPEQPTAAAPPDAGVTLAGSVEWIYEFTLGEAYGTSVRAGKDTILVAHENAMPDDLGGYHGDVGSLVVAAFDLEHKRKWIVDLYDAQKHQVGALGVAPNGITWVHSHAAPSSDPSYRPESMLTRIDGSGKPSWSRKLPGLHHGHAIAFTASGETAVAYGESDARELGGKSVPNPKPPRAVVMFFDPSGNAVGEWSARSESVNIAFDASGRAYAELQLDESTVRLAGEAVKGPGPVLVELGPDRKPAKVIRRKDSYQAYVPGTPLKLFQVDRGRAANGQLLAWSDVVERDFAEQELWRKRVCEETCFFERLAANPQGETLFLGRSSAAVGNPLAPTVPTPSTEVGLPYRLVKLDAKGAVRFAVVGSCVTSADLLTQGSVAVIGTDRDREVVLADRLLPAKKQRNYLALLRP